jgi:hypothetical protein
MPAFAVEQFSLDLDFSLGEEAAFMAALAALVAGWARDCVLAAAAHAAIKRVRKICFMV